MQEKLVSFAAAFRIYVEQEVLRKQRESVAIQYSTVDEFLTTFPKVLDDRDVCTFFLGRWDTTVTRLMNGKKFSKDPAVFVELLRSEMAVLFGVLQTKIFRDDIVGFADHREPKKEKQRLLGLLNPKNEKERKEQLKIAKPFNIKELDQFCVEVGVAEIEMQQEMLQNRQRVSAGKRGTGGKAVLEEEKAGRKMSSSPHGSKSPELAKRQSSVPKGGQAAGDHRGKSSILKPKPTRSSAGAKPVSDKPPKGGTEENKRKNNRRAREEPPTDK